MNKISKRSKIPPWPGKIFPLSFTPIWRLNIDSTKSPSVPIVETITEITIQCCIANILENFEITTPAIIVNKNPPTKPSQLFFGECLSKRRCFPNFTPVKYAKVSLHHAKIKILKSNRGWNYELYWIIRFVVEIGKII